MNILNVIGISLFTLAIIVGIVFFFRFLSQRLILQNIHSMTPHSGLSIVDHITIGGIHQWISIETTNLNNPILLFLHGGPGMPLPYGVAFRNHHQQLASAFILVLWDQRGAGKSFNPNIPEGSLNVTQFVSDTEELIIYLKKRFNKDKIFLAANSWGTVIGLNYVSCYPDDIFAYFALEQLIDTKKADAIAYQWALAKCTLNHRPKISQTLQRIGPPPYNNGKWGTFRQILRQLGAYIYQAKGVKSPSLFSMIHPVLVSPDYAFGDI